MIRLIWSKPLFWIGAAVLSWILATAVSVADTSDESPDASTLSSSRGQAPELPAHEQALLIPEVIKGSPIAAAQSAAQSASNYSLDYYGYIAPPWYGGEGGPEFIAVELGDVTGDGLADIVSIASDVGAPHPRELMVVAQKAGGSLALHASYPLLERGYSLSLWIVLAHLNDDGAKDVIAVGPESFLIFLSDGKGRLESSGELPIYDPIDVGARLPPVVMDINQDGHLDLVFHVSRTHAGASGFPTEETHSRLVIWFGDGAGGFAGRVSFKTYGSDPYDVENANSMVAGDFDSDGRIDLAIRVTQHDHLAQRKHHLVRVYYHDRQQSLMPSIDYQAIMETGSNFSSLYHLAIGDFNGDGRQDLAGVSDGISRRIWILSQSQSGQFDLPPVVMSTEPIGIAPRVADIDNNGLDDLLVAHSGWDRITYYLQSTSSLEGPIVRNLETYLDPRIGVAGMSAADLTGNGCADVVVAASYYGLRIFHGKNCAPLHTSPPMIVCPAIDGSTDLQYSSGPIFGQEVQQTSPYLDPLNDRPQPSERPHSRFE